MKLLLDEALPYSAAALLTSRGIDALHIVDIGFVSFKDEAIIEKARAEEWVIATYDSDFHALLALSGQQYPSVIRIRIEKLRAPALADLLEYVIEECTNTLLQGALVTVLEGRIRIRRLPI
jgi:predicted nuclease of predicted toxin-antitoxin system